MDYLAWLLQTYGANGIVLDTNVLLLHIVGYLDPTLLRKIKRTSQFEEADYTLLVNLLTFTPRILITPGILAESCDLLESANAKLEQRIFSTIRTISQVVTERYTPARILTTIPLFLKFGLTDSSIINLATRGSIILSDDLPLSATLSRLGLPVLNFNHLRSASWIQ